MIEITAKQLYEIYKGLPDVFQWQSNYRDEPYRVAIMNPPDISSMSFSSDRMRTFSTKEVEFRIDFGTYPYEWKPTTDLIIKS